MTQPTVLVVYCTVHGHSRKVVEYVAASLSREGIVVERADLIRGRSRRLRR